MADGHGQRPGGDVPDLHGCRLRHPHGPALERDDGDADVRLEPRVPARRAARRCTPTATSGCASWARSSRVLDPIVAVLDALPEHFDPDYAPRHILNLLSAWLGVDLDESQPITVQRDTIRRAAELGRRRGTKGGLELALSLAFPDVPLRVEDDGGVVYSTNSRAGGIKAAAIRRVLRQARRREDPGRHRTLH